MLTLNGKLTEMKTDTIDVVDAWQAVAVSSIMRGTPFALAGNRDTLINVEVAYTSANANALGPLLEIYLSPTGVGDWKLLTSLRGTAETAATTTVNDATVVAGDTTITLTDATTGDFDVKGRKWYIKDATIGNSESVITRSNAAHVVTLLNPLVRSHANGLNVYDRVVDFLPIPIPDSSGFGMVVVNNDDADCTLDARSYITRIF